MLTTATGAQCPRCGLVWTPIEQLYRPELASWERVRHAEGSHRYRAWTKADAASRAGEVNRR